MLTINMDGREIQGNANEIAELLKLMETAQAETPAAKPRKAAKPAKAKVGTPKPKRQKREHAAVLDTKRVENMTARAIAAAAKAGFQVKASKQREWVWLYPCEKSSGQGRTEEFKALKLAKGWNYSPKRGAWYRDFSQA